MRLNWLLGSLFFGLIQGAFLSTAPGLHYDEAWAANFSARIASEPGFWPLAAQSPYASPWSEYVTALGFRLFGPEVWVLRAVGLLFVFGGLLFLRRALIRLKQREAADLVIWTCTIPLGLVLNHRFAIEITTFHVLCLGLFADGLAQAWTESEAHEPLSWSASLKIAAASILGVTSHLLFLAPVGAAWVIRMAQGSPLDKRARVLLGGIIVALIPFFFRIFLLVPERDKALALLIGLGASLVWTVWISGRWTVSQTFGRKALVLLSWCALPFGLMMGFFWEGTWSVLMMTGLISERFLFGLSLLPLFAGLVLGRRALKRAPWPQVLQFTALVLLALGALMLKPTARYFEMGMILASVCVAGALTAFPPRVRTTLIGFGAFFAILQMGANVWTPIRTDRVIESRFHWLLFKDESRDFLPKQTLARWLSDHGCRLVQISSPDSRVMEALQFLARNPSWSQVQGTCVARKLLVYRSAEPPVQANPSRVLARFDGFTIEAEDVSG